MQEGVLDIWRKPFHGHRLRPHAQHAILPRRTACDATNHGNNQGICSPRADRQGAFATARDPMGLPTSEWLPSRLGSKVVHLHTRYAIEHADHNPPTLLHPGRTLWRCDSNHHGIAVHGDSLGIADRNQVRCHKDVIHPVEVQAVVLLAFHFPVIIVMVHSASLLRTAHDRHRDLFDSTKTV